MRMRFQCKGCGRTLSQSYASDPSNGDVYARPWYSDDAGLAHLMIVCLSCGTVHDCSGSFLKGLLTLGRSPMKVHGVIPLRTVIESVVTRMLSRTPASAAFSHGQPAIPDEVVNVLIKRGLFERPVRCGAVISYRQGRDRESETFGEFLFPATEVENVLVSRLRESPHLIDGDEGAILAWIDKRDRKAVVPTKVPSPWSRFQYIADELIREGQGKVRCLRCDRTFPTGDLIPKDDRARPGWNFDRLQCPQGHPLLVVEKVHLLMKSR